MDAQAPRPQPRRVLAARDRAASQNVENTRQPSKKSKTSEKSTLPLLVTGKEALGRELSVFKTSNKNAVWVKGAVKDFDEPSVKHKICYERPLPGVQPGAVEEWLCLGKSMFMWSDEDFACSHANPTFSLKHTPKGEAAIGKRIKMFWTAMGRWYQGKVVDFDSSSGKHQISFRDGDLKHCLLRQEALVWLDIPELCSDSAIKRMRAEEGHPTSAAVFRGSENQAPEEGAQGSSSGLKQEATENGKARTKTTVNGKRKIRTAASPCEVLPTDIQSQKRKPAKVQDRQKSAQKSSVEKKKEVQQTSTSGKAASEAHTAASGSKEAVTKSLGVATDARRNARTTGQTADDSKSASSSSRAAAEVEGSKAADKPAKKQKAAAQPKLAVPNTLAQKPEASKATAAVHKPEQPAEETSRKRSRLGIPALAVSQQQALTEPDAKRRLTVKAPKMAAVVKPGRKPKKVSEESRLGLRRQKSAVDVEFEAACQAVMGARVGVWWEDDSCYYKGKIVAHDWYHKRLKILYDDGIEEFISPQKSQTRFTWLTPRAQTAGATDAVHAAFRLLHAANAVLPVTASEAQQQTAATPVTASLATVSPAADGSHLDALVPRRPSSAAGKPEEGKPCGQQTGHQSGISIPHPVDSTTRAQPSQVKSSVLLGVATPAAWPNLPLRNLPGTPASATGSLLTGLQAMVPPSGLQVSSAPKQSEVPSTAVALHQKLLAAHGAAVTQCRPEMPVATVGEKRFAMTPEPGKPVAPVAQKIPLGHAAEGWKVSIVFRGDNQIFQGRVLVYDAKKQSHHILWDDGEDEWVNVTKEQLSWHAERQKTAAISAGLPAGQQEPKGDDLIGWRIAVYWKEEKQFYQGSVEDYDAELDQHTISYNDGDELCESLCGQTFKFVLPPTVQAVGARRVSTRKRVGSSEREDADCRPRRKARVAHRDDASDNNDDEDSDTEWGRGLIIPADRKPTARQLSHLQREASTPAVTTPHACDIRRLNSKVGSLLVYKGEDNHIEGATGNSPKFLPRGTQLPDVASEVPDPRGQPVLDRRISGLKCAQGFRVAVKRVRVFLPEAKSAEAAQAPADGDKGDVPSQESLKQMLQRVDMAQQSIKSGIPAGVFGQLPSGRADRVEGKPLNKALLPQGTTSPPAALHNTSQPPLPDLQSPASTLQCKAEPQEDAPSLVLAVEPPASPVHAQQEVHVTPPPSPFAPFAKKDVNSPLGEDEEEDDALLHLEVPDELEAVVPGQKCCGPESSHAVPVLANGSFSVPNTPSAVSEGLVGPSRNGSVISAPILAELALVKAGLVRGIRKETEGRTVSP